MELVKAQQYQDSGAVRVASCGHCVDIHAEKMGCAGYALDKAGNTTCYACAGTLDREALERGERTGLYFTSSGVSPRKLTAQTGHGWASGRVSNWPGSWSTIASVHYTRTRAHGKISAHIKFYVQSEENGFTWFRAYWGRIGDTDFNQSFVAIPYKGKPKK